MSLKGHDATHKTWYFLQENDGFYWNRYKKFLKDKKHWSTDVVNRLHTTTNDVMDDLGNPNDKDRPFQRRGLLLGDVQSGKTATYTAICNKAADANYKVIIVLAGMMENLRVQTQERLDAEFVGKESKYTLDRKADNEIRNHPVGVGKIQSDNERQIACFTSVATDFNKTTLKQLGLSLSNLNGTALFVVKKNKSVPDLFEERKQLLFKEYPYPTPKKERNITIGIPRVLSYWDTMPFWTTFFKTLGYNVQLSDESTREIYESGLSAVTSDTVCFPAKLVHGHLRNLVKKYHVDRIFMPSITTVPPENTEKTSESMCAVVKGYPIVIRNSDNPQDKWNVPFDAPLFHWHTKKDRQRQLLAYMQDEYHISKEEVLEAMRAGDLAQKSFEEQLKKRGQKILDDVEEKDSFAVVLASRPYQNDTLVIHDLSKMFIKA